MSNATPRLVTRTTRRELVVLRFVETISEVYEAPVSSIFAELPTPRRVVNAAPATKLQLVRAR